ncbi:MAG: aldo/keto reductase, partial [Actinomycetota bacterium]|nr:aldo/keto reductase [Actinomycetota bacterium]
MTSLGTAATTATLGTTDLEVTRVGLGAWAIGGGGWQGGWGPQDDRESIETIRRAVDLGVNWIDTAAAYGLGHAEEIVGRAVRDMPEDERPLVFTKCGLVWEAGGTTVSNVLAPASIRRECEDSLRRLGVDVIDLYQIHWPATDGTPIEESWSTMADLVDEGKVRYIGVSNFDVDLLEACETVRHVDTFQPELNLLVRGAAATTLPWCEARNTGVIVYSPMRSGLLTGAFTAARAESLPDDDWRSAHPDFQEPGLSANLLVVDRLQAIARETGCTLHELAVAWTLAWPAVGGAIVGARRPSQLDDWIGAGAIELDDDRL